MAIDQFALIQGARQAEMDNMARAKFDVEQAQRVGNLAQNRQTWDLLYPQAQMNAEQNMAELAAKQKAAVTSADAIANSRNASAQYGVQDPTQYGVQDPTQYGVQPQAGVAASQMMQQIQGGGQSFGQPFNALQNQSLDPNAQRFDALAGVTQDVAQTQQYPQGVAQTQQYPQGLTDLQRVQAVPTQGAALMQQIQAPGSDPRVAAGAQAFQQSMGQALDQYRPGGSALVDALTMRENLAAQSGIAQKFFGNDRVAAAMAANTGFGSALTAPEEQQRARNIASMNLQAPGALESLGATRDMNGTYINYNGMTFGSDADFKTYLSNRAMAGANGAIDSLKTEGAGAKANLDLNIMRNVADIMIANAQVPNIEFHRGVNGNYIAVPKMGATPEQVAQGNAVAAQVNAASAEAAAKVTPAAEPGETVTQPVASPPTATQGQDFRLFPGDPTTNEVFARVARESGLAGVGGGHGRMAGDPALVGVDRGALSLLQRLRSTVGTDKSYDISNTLSSIPTQAGAEASKLMGQLTVATTRRDQAQSRGDTAEATRQNAFIAAQQPMLAQLYAQHLTQADMTRRQIAAMRIRDAVLAEQGLQYQPMFDPASQPYAAQAEQALINSRR